MNLKNTSFLLLLWFMVNACSNKYHKFASNYTYKNVEAEPNYNNLANWAAHPYKTDPSDSVPLPLRESYRPDSTIDIFFIHPTTYTNENKSFGQNAPIDDAELNAKTDYSTILFQASIFNEAGRVFSPRYRQAHLSSYFPKNEDDTLHAIASFELAYQDVKNAFAFYLLQYNKGRPIIIASHSQGTTHAKRLLKEFFEGTVLQTHLVVAYLIGIPLEPDYFSRLTPCTSPIQTGCFCGWRTFKEGYQPEYIEKEKFISTVTNPLTWDALTPRADRSLNKGGLLLNFNKIIPKVANANINNGVLWTDKPHFFGNVFLRSKNYHVGDMNLYYLNIRENVKQRIVAFWKK